MSRKRAQVTDENARATLGAGGILAHIGEELADGLCGGGPRSAHRADQT